MKDTITENADTHQESRPKIKETSSPKLSSRGISAMRGEIATKHEATLDRRDLRDVEIKAARHLKTPAVNERDNRNKMKVYERKLQGEMGEEAMRKTGAESLNDYKSNFPVYDFITKDEIASVKTHMPSEKYPRAYLSNYAHDLRVALGTIKAKDGKYQGRSSTSFAAEALSQFDHHQRPEGWEEIAPQKMESVIQERSTLRIPADHVQQARNYVHSAARRSPEKYGFNHLPDNKELEQLTERIKPLPINSEQIRTRVQNRMQGLNMSI